MPTCRIVLVSAGLLAILSGCDRGPDIGTVTGTVTLDGQPVDGGLIRMVPSDGNSQPADSVITGGEYSITMPLGPKKVEIYWTKGGGGNVDTASQGNEKVLQLVAAKYNTASTLNYTVEKGQAVKD